MPANQSGSNKTWVWNADLLVPFSVSSISFLSDSLSLAWHVHGRGRRRPCGASSRL